MSDFLDTVLTTRRQDVINDCVRLVEEEVSRKTGLSGVALKGAFALIRRVRPDITAFVVDTLLEKFVHAMEPVVREFQAQSQAASFETFVAPRTSQVANALLGVTDRAAASGKNRVVIKAYEKLRPAAQKHVEAAVPGLARTLARYLV